MLKVRQIDFIEDEKELKEFLNHLFKMLVEYHKEAMSEDLDFATDVFIQGWKDKAFYVFFLMNEETNEPVGFAIASVGINLLANKTTFNLSHAYMEEKYRGNMKVLGGAITDIMAYKDKLGMDIGTVDVSPELMPLVLKLTDGKLLYSTLGM